MFFPRLHNYCKGEEYCGPDNVFNHTIWQKLLQINIPRWPALVVVSKFLFASLCCLWAVLFSNNIVALVIVLSQIPSIFDIKSSKYRDMFKMHSPEIITTSSGKGFVSTSRIYKMLKVDETRLQEK